VAGTKGKGSVSAFCASVLEAEGYKVGLYTSPHLRDFEERIQVNGDPLSRKDLVALVEQIKPHVAAVPRLTTFEISTALGFWHFARQKVDVAVIEVGLGGRLDATNVILPRVSVITSLSLDHTYVLGDTLGEIAAEKSGIIKPGVPVVLAPQAEEARRVVAQVAGEHNAPLLQVGKDILYSIQSKSLEGQTLSISRPDNQTEPVILDINLLGEHQAENAAVAYAALQLFSDHGLAVSPRVIREGFASAHWPGRFEVLNPAPPLVVDAAHNPYSMRALKHTLDEYYPDKPVILVFGVSEDKDVQAMFAELQPRVKHVIASESTHPRAMHAQELADEIRPFGCPVEAIPDVAAAVHQALTQAGQDALVLVTGSIFVVATARIAWFEEREVFEGLKKP
jgi:dihydrofolate synthase/folylpolyglutamate synthase